MFHYGLKVDSSKKSEFAIYQTVQHARRHLSFTLLWLYRNLVCSTLSTLTLERNCLATILELGMSVYISGGKAVNPQIILLCSQRWLVLISFTGRYV